MPILNALIGISLFFGKKGISIMNNKKQMELKLEIDLFEGLLVGTLIAVIVGALKNGWIK